MRPYDRCVASLLVTNDFPPKVGGIQSYLHELWRRLPPGETTVLTTPHEGAEAFDAAEAFRIERTPERVLLPTRPLARRIDAQPGPLRRRRRRGTVTISNRSA